MTLLHKKPFDKLSMILLPCLISSHFAQADIYPGDANYSDIVQEIYHDISADNINLAYDNNYNNRVELCQKLIDQHNGATPGAATQTNASFIGETVSLNTCKNALWYSSGYNNSSDLAAWSGIMSGTWYDESGQTFNDPAVWKLPINLPANDPSDTDASGFSRVYIFQEVVFSGPDRTGQARFGWNQSHHEVDYIWGWDPKDNTNDNGQVGTHVGWTFNQGTAKCIIWITKNEAFLECIKSFGGAKKRTSAGLFGIGQWNISPLTSRPPPRDFPIPIDVIR